MENIEGPKIEKLNQKGAVEELIAAHHIEDTLEGMDALDKQKLVQLKALYDIRRDHSEAILENHYFRTNLQNSYKVTAILSLLGGIITLLFPSYLNQILSIILSNTLFKMGVVAWIFQGVVNPLTMVWWHTEGKKEVEELKEEYREKISKMTIEEEEVEKKKPALQEVPNATMQKEATE